MAVDEWLLQRATESENTVYLRVYSWARSCISIGYHQDYERAISSDLLGGTPVVRRVTGGRGLLHEVSELTYAIAAPICDEGNSEKKGGSNRGERVLALSRSLAVSGRLIAESLQNALAQTGITAELVRGKIGGEIKGGEFHTLPCIASTSRYELVSGERKMVASAQRRLSQAFLQHGSIKIEPARQHPALAPECGQQRHVDKQVSEQTVEAFSVALGQELSVRLELPAIKSTYSNRDKAELRLLWEKVSQKPLFRRTILCTE